MPVVFNPNKVIEGAVSSGGNPLAGVPVVLYRRDTGEYFADSTSQIDGTYIFSRSDFIDNILYFAVAINPVTGDIILHDSLRPIDTNQTYPFDEITGVGLDDYSTKKVNTTSMCELGNYRIAVVFEEESVTNVKNGCIEVGQIVGNDLTYYPQLIFHSGRTESMDVCQITNSYCVIAYRDGEGVGAGHIQLVELNTGTNTFSLVGSAVIFDINSVENCRIVKLDSTNCVLSYIDDGGNGVTKVITLTGTSLSVGSPFYFSATPIEFDMDALDFGNSVIIAYVSSSNNKGYVRIGTIDYVDPTGYEVNFGGYVSFSGETAPNSISVSHLTNDRAALSFRDGNKNNRLLAMALVREGANDYIDPVGLHYEICPNAGSSCVSSASAWNALWFYNDNATGSTYVIIGYFDDNHGIIMNFTEPLLVDGNTISKLTAQFVGSEHFMVAIGNNEIVTGGRSITIIGDNATTGGGGL